MRPWDSLITGLALAEAWPQLPAETSAERQAHEAHILTAAASGHRMKSETDDMVELSFLHCRLPSSDAGTLMDDYGPYESTHL